MQLCRNVLQSNGRHYGTVTVPFRLSTRGQDCGSTPDCSLTRRFYPRLVVVGGCSGDTGEGLSIGGGAIMYGGMKAFSPGHGVTAKMQSRSIGAAPNAAAKTSL